MMKNLLYKFYDLNLLYIILNADVSLILIRNTSSRRLKRKTIFFIHRIPEIKI